MGVAMSGHAVDNDHGASGKAPMSDHDSDRDAIIALIHRNRIAIWTHDFDLWEACFVHADYTARWGWWQAGGMFARRGWDDIARRLRSNPPPAIDAYAYDTKLLNLSLQIGDGMAWATFDQLYPEGASRYGGGTGLVREARVFEKHDGEWKIAFLCMMTGVPGGPRIVHLDAAGRIVFRSDAAAEAMAADDNIIVRNGALRFRDRRADRMLREAVAWASTLDSGFMSTHGALPILVEAGEGLPTGIYWVIADAGLVLFSFGDPALSERRLDMAARVYGLSPAQRILAGHVAEGLTLTEIAERMQVTANTARTHLNRVFDKTGVRTQPALVRVLLTAIAPV
jgi:DNA-binding CsgD family transcriptional regulator